MTLDEAIEYYTKVATQRAIADEEMGVNDNSKWNETKFMTKKESEQIIADNQQLAEWLTELKEAKRLLKLALNDFETIESNLEYDEHCVIKTHSIRCDECPLSADTIYRCKWRYADEALALIGEDREQND